ncbi:MAG: YqhA family protein [Hyphomicrobium sp.]|jgi:uncharacterized membrane protein YqhA
MLSAALSLRLVLLAAAFGTMVGALIMFWQGLELTFDAALGLYRHADHKLITAAVMGATDIFLFGIVLVIFTYAIVFGFVFKLARHDRKRLRAWMRPTGMHELKTTLIGAILVYLVVDFATDWAELGHNISWTLIVKPASILMLAAALRLFANEPNTDDDNSTDTAPTPAPAARSPSAPLQV